MTTKSRTGMYRELYLRSELIKYGDPRNNISTVTTTFLIQRHAHYKFLDKYTSLQTLDSPPLILEIPRLLIKGEGISPSGVISHSLSQSTTSFSLPRKVFLAANLIIPLDFSPLARTVDVCFRAVASAAAAARRLV